MYCFFRQYYISFLISALCLLLASFYSSHLLAQQYRSTELLPSTFSDKPQSLDELEQALSSNALSDNAYAKSSTALYLARHYAQQVSSDGNVSQLIKDKAESYYLQSLAGDGLSEYAKQAIYVELAQIYLASAQYKKLLAILDKRREAGGKNTATLLLVEAQAFHHLAKNSLAEQTADAAWAAEPKPTLEFYFQLRSLYFKLNAYSQTIKVQKKIIEINKAQLNEWRYLSGLYLKINNFAKAADSLVLAKRYGLKLTGKDYLQLSSLYAKNQSPLLAAEAIQAAFDENVLDISIEHLEQQLNYWLLAKETPMAIQTLAEIIEQDATPFRYLYLAQLQQSQQQWLAMKQSVEQACALNMQDRYISQANLLLGISELKLGNVQQARLAFINATMIGGQMAQARQYLDFMQAQAIQAEEQDNFKGVCTPKWAKADDYAVVANSMLPAGEGEKFFSVDVADIEKTTMAYTVETLAEQWLVSSFHQLPLAALEKEIKSLAMKLAMFISRHEGEIGGDFTMIFPEPYQVGQEHLTFYLAFPVNKKPKVRGIYQFKQDKNYKAAIAIFKGDPKTLPQFWIDFYTTVLQDGLSVTGESRQVLINARSARKDFIQMKLLIELEN